MAIDFMVMPLSRYLTGDFVTPQMQWSWDSGVPYSVYGPQGKQEFPKGVPFGGVQAPQNRVGCRELLREDLAQFPLEVMARPWDEASAAEPRFHRVDPKSFGALLAHADALAGKPGRRFFGLLAGQPRGPLHCQAGVFLPGDFEKPFTMRSPFVDRLTGSAVRALAELEREDWPEPAHAARETLRDALKDAAALQLPMIIDS